MVSTIMKFIDISQGLVFTCFILGFLTDTLTLVATYLFDVKSHVRRIIVEILSLHDTIDIGVS